MSVTPRGHDGVMSKSSTSLPDEYPALLEQLKSEVRAAQFRAHRLVNTELLTLYWKIGKAILERQSVEGWGAKVIDHLARDLSSAFPEMKGWSRANLHYMRKVAEFWPDKFVQQPAGQIPWGHLMVILDKTSDRPTCDWYAAQAAEHGWSRAVLMHHIQSHLHRRVGAAPSNFGAALPSEDSEFAQQLVKDPYNFEFLGLGNETAEKELEDALVSNLQKFMLELGAGFAFVGRQWHFEVEGDDFWIDLLFFNYQQSRFVVMELKVKKFSPSHAGQLGMYVSWVDENLRDQKNHQPTLGILLCASKNNSVVRYSLGGTSAPMAVSVYKSGDSTYDWDSLPSREQLGLPSAAELAEIVEHPVVGGKRTDLAEWLDDET